MFSPNPKEISQLKVFKNTCLRLKKTKAIKLEYFKKLYAISWFDIREGRMSIISKGYDDEENEDWLNLFNVEIRKFQLKKDIQYFSNIKTILVSIVNASQLSEREKLEFNNFMGHLELNWNEAEEDHTYDNMIHIGKMGDFFVSNNQIMHKDDTVWIDTSSTGATKRQLYGGLLHHEEKYDYQNSIIYKSKALKVLDIVKSVNISFLRLAVIFKLEMLVDEIFSKKKENYSLINAIIHIENNWNKTLNLPDYIWIHFRFNLRENIESFINNNVWIYPDDNYVFNWVNISYNVPKDEDEAQSFYKTLRELHKKYPPQTLRQRWPAHP